LATDCYFGNLTGPSRISIIILQNCEYRPAPH
jgi:hypothetical protein